MQNAAEPFASHDVPQPLQRFEHWVIRFARAMLFDALPLSHPQVAIGGELGKKRLDQRRFANPRFSSDENSVPVPTCCPV